MALFERLATQGRTSTTRHGVVWPVALYAKVGDTLPLLLPPLRNRIRTLLCQGTVISRIPQRVAVTVYLHRGTVQLSHLLIPGFKIPLLRLDDRS